MNETTLRTVDGRSVLVMERRLKHRPEKVWRAITEPAHFNEWYPYPMDIELKVGGRMRAVAEDGGEPEEAGVVTELDPPRVFAFQEGEDVLRLELRPDGDGCLLTFTHTFDDRPAAASYAAGWDDCLDGLAMVADGRPVDVSSDSVARHEHYVQRFGLTKGTGGRTPQGWRIRFERQLRQPVDEVWAELTVDGVSDTPPPAATTGAVPAGGVTAVEAPTLLEYRWPAGDDSRGRVRWELSPGPGGARLVLSQTGPGELPLDVPATLAAWERHIEGLAARLVAAKR